MIVNITKRQLDALIAFGQKKDTIADQSAIAELGQSLSKDLPPRRKMIDWPVTKLIKHINRMERK